MSAWLLESNAIEVYVPPVLSTIAGLVNRTSASAPPVPEGLMVVLNIRVSAVAASGLLKPPVVLDELQVVVELFVWVMVKAAWAGAVKKTAVTSKMEVEIVSLRSFICLNLQ
jgi:hypothetical protein